MRPTALPRRRGARHDRKTYLARAVVFATGYYDNPNYMGVPGEDLPHVSHYFLEGHPYWHRRVIVIGAGNSSVDAALECWRAGAAVTLVHFGEGFDRTVKAWVLPDITNRVKQGSIGCALALARPRHHAHRGRGSVGRNGSGGTDARRCRAGDDRLPRRHGDAPPLGVPVDPVCGVPAYDEATMATPVAGVYLAGVIASGNDANRLFIENARGHGELIVSHLVATRKATAGSFTPAAR